MGPVPPWGPPASGVVFCCFWCWPGFCGCGVGVGGGWLCAKSPSGSASHRVAISVGTARSRVLASILKKQDVLTARRKNISGCLFVRFYISIDALTYLFRGHFFISGGFGRAPFLNTRFLRMRQVVFFFALFVVLPLRHLPARAGDGPAQS